MTNSKSALDVIVPVFNEQKVLATSIKCLYEFLSNEMNQYNWSIVITDNGSTDDTQVIATALADRLPNVYYRRLNQKGKGAALRFGLSKSRADIITYMDVDLSTDLSFLPPLVKAIEDKHNLAIGSRLLKDSVVTNQIKKRRLLSLIYNYLIRLLFSVNFRDAQCGFKAIDRKTADTLIPLVKDDSWFFDSELLILAQYCNYTICEIPVYWQDDPDSSVKIIPTVVGNLCGLLRLRFGGVGQAKRKLISGD